MSSIITNNKHLNSIKDISIYDLSVITQYMDDIKYNFKIPPPILPNILFGLLFFEPSTRTHCSFKAAIINLGANYIDLPDNSSSKKGESDIDTVRTFMEYCNCLIIRHPEIGFVNKCIDIVNKFGYNVNIINAGDGAGEHPTQAINDILYIHNWKSNNSPANIKNKSIINITITGDIDNGRAVNSLLAILTKINNTNNSGVKYIGDVKFNINYITDINKTNTILDDTDVLYMTRTQTERGSADNSNKFILNKNLLDKLPPSSIILHPLPRRDELPEYVDNNNRAHYFEQAGLAVYSRMAILMHLLL